MTRHLYRGDARRLTMLDDSSVDLVVTSPPYFRQRTYGDSSAEIGNEDSLDEYVAFIADAFDEIRRVLAPHGHAWLNIGDKANGSGGAGGDWQRPGNTRTWRAQSQGPGRFSDPAYADQSFLDVPGAVLRELLRRRWRLRLPIVWHKVGAGEIASMKHLNRPLWSHEMLYLLAPERDRRRKVRPRFYPSALEERGSVWTFPARNRERRSSEAGQHLAPFPDQLARRCILPCTMPGDRVLDPFMGSGTVPRVAELLGRIGIGVDLYHEAPETPPINLK